MSDTPLSSNELLQTALRRAHTCRAFGARTDEQHWLAALHEEIERLKLENQTLRAPSEPPAVQVTAAISDPNLVGTCLSCGQRAVVPPTATEEWQSVIRETLEICRDLLDGGQIDRHFLRVSIQTILDEWQPLTKESAPHPGFSSGTEQLAEFDRRKLSGETSPVHGGRPMTLRECMDAEDGGADHE